MYQSLKLHSMSTLTHPRRLKIFMNRLTLLISPLKSKHHLVCASPKTTRLVTNAIVPYFVISEFIQFICHMGWENKYFSVIKGLHSFLQNVQFLSLRVLVLAPDEVVKY